MPSYQNRSGDQLWYEEQGGGDPIVFVHGWCLSSAVWKYQFDALAGSYRLLAPDLRGHGRSRKISRDLNFVSFADDLVDLCEALDLARVVLVGWSMGAQIALQAFSRLSRRLAGMVLVSATPRFTASAVFSFGLPEKEAQGMRLKLLRNHQRAVAGFYTRLFAEGELESQSLASEIRGILASITPPDTNAALESLDALVVADMSHLLSSVSIPTLIMNGALDQICLPQASCYMHEQIPGAEHFVFPHTGHAPFLTEHGQFNDELIRFTRSVCEQHA